MTATPATGDYDDGQATINFDARETLRQRQEIQQ